jgi:hypothetical protein
MNIHYTTITFEQINGKEYWHILAGNLQSTGYSDTLENAEKIAYQVLNTIPDHGTVHCIYRNGKKVKERIAHN